MTLRWAARCRQTKSNSTNVVVVDGSNIATEGRSMPSLSQLNDAVMAFREEFPDAVVTVVVDATFGHRIDKKEAAEFDAAVAHNELVAPPAGAIGRGDAFVLSIANKVGARILSNDSFQEFHGDYPWLFDEGRLIGGKPVPLVGWVFVERLPVKGPVSRKSQRAAARRSHRRAEGGRGGKRAERRASRCRCRRHLRREPGRGAQAARARGDRPRRHRSPAPPVNDLLPFLDFVEHHPVGSSVNGVVESYASHGAYVGVGDLRGYIPLRLMGDPPPRSAREAMKIGDAVTLVVTSFAPGRRSVDLAVPRRSRPSPTCEPGTELEELRRGRRSGRAARSKRDPRRSLVEEPPRARRTKKAAEDPPFVAEPDEAAATPPPAKKAARKAPAKAAAPAEGGHQGDGEEGGDQVASQNATTKKAACGRAVGGRGRRDDRRRSGCLGSGGEGGAGVMRFASWNVNSLKVRQERVEQWLADISPDVSCMQETKLADDAFPQLTLEAMGYDVRAPRRGPLERGGGAVPARARRRLVRLRRRRRTRLRGAHHDGSLRRHHRHHRLCAQRPCARRRPLRVQAGLARPPGGAHRRGEQARRSGDRGR